MGSSEERSDYLLVGGGLQNSLIALALLARRPNARIVLIEREARVGGEHTWCFHAADVEEDMAPVVDPLIEHRWQGYSVRFPDFTRELSSPYFGFGSERMHEVVAARIAVHDGAELLLETPVADVGAHAVTLADGRVLHGEVVVDARGPEIAGSEGCAGYQKFVGREVLLARPHGLVRPIVMDATVCQRDGFRFVYVLPMGARRLLIEDTYFADGPELDVSALRAEIDVYAEAKGYEVTQVLREERGVLPMPWRGAQPSAARPLRAGYRGGWLHPATGYSFPVALRLAALIAQLPAARLFGDELASLVRAQRRQARFAARLNRLLFHWFLPTARRPVFARFYRLPEATIGRFYALRTTLADRARILVGRPPPGLSLRARLSVSGRLHGAVCR